MGVADKYLEEKELGGLLESLGPEVEAAVERGLAAVSKKDGSLVQPPRSIVPSGEGALLTMPAFSSSERVLGCKVVTSFRGNPGRGLPSILATVLLFEPDTGRFKVAMEGAEMTARRTAAASLVATRLLHRGEKRVLAVLGAGAQARAHARLLHNAFHFKEVRIWNRTGERAEKLAASLNEESGGGGGGGVYRAVSSNEECVRGADVVATCTYASRPIVEYSWLRPGVHINAVGAGETHYSELEPEVYENSAVFVDSLEAARKELRGIPATLQTEIGEILEGTAEFPGAGSPPLTVFHGLGMAIEDVLVADILFKAYERKLIEEEKKTPNTSAKSC